MTEPLTTAEVELAVVHYFDPRENLIIPNISWGFDIHECDLVVLRPSKYMYEVEIKASKQDLKADLTKPHQHKDDRIKRLYFAVPAELRDAALQLAPERAGLITVRPTVIAEIHHGKLITKVEIRGHLVREAQDNPDSRKLTDDEIMDLARLGILRIFPLKKKILQLKRMLKEDRQHEQTEVESSMRQD
jgi:hypothetical protein